LAFYVDARGFQVVQCAATGTLNLKVNGLPFGEQAVAIAATNFILHLSISLRLPHGSAISSVPVQVHGIADTLRNGCCHPWGRGAVLVHRSGGGVCAPSPVPQ